MSAEAASLDELLSQLETAIGKLTDDRAPLDELVSTYEQAGRLMEAAEARLAALAERAAHTA